MKDEEINLLLSIRIQATEMLEQQQAGDNREHAFWLHVDKDVLTRIDQDLSDMNTNIDLEIIGEFNDP